MTEPREQRPVTALRGVGDALAARLAVLGVETVQDLLFVLPTRYEDRTRVQPIGALLAGGRAVVEGEVQLTEVVFRRRRQMLCRIADGSGFLTLRFFHFSSAQQQGLERGNRLRCFGEVRRGPMGLEIVHPEYRRIFDERSPLEESLTPVYPATEGVSQGRLRVLIAQALRELDSAGVRDWLPPAILAPLGLPPLREALRYVHRPMYVAQRFAQRRQSEWRKDCGRQPVANACAVELAQGLCDEHSQPALTHAFGGGVNRRQRFFQRRAFVKDSSILRMHDLETHGSAAYLAEAAQTIATFQALLLGAGEMKETQRQEAGTVGNATEHLSPPPKYDFGQLHLAFDDGATAGEQRADRLHASPIFITRGQYEQQILHGLDAEHREARSECIADSAQSRDRSLLTRLGHDGAA